jgi:ribosomal protein S27E
MDETTLRLDGNALAGPFQEIFVHEMTAAQVSCAHCGRVEPVGAEHVYAHAPGAVVRCRHCEGLLMVIVQGGGKYRLTFQGSRWLEIPEGG